MCQLNSRNDYIICNIIPAIILNIFLVMFFNEMQKRKWLMMGKCYKYVNSKGELGFWLFTGEMKGSHKKEVLSQFKIRNELTGHGGNVDGLSFIIIFQSQAIGIPEPEIVGWLLVV